MRFLLCPVCDDIITTRAVMPIPMLGRNASKFLNLAGHHCRSKKREFAMKCKIAVSDVLSGRAC